MILNHHFLHVSSRVLLFLILISAAWVVYQGIKSNEYRRIEEPQVVTLLDEPEPEEEIIIEEEPEVVEVEEYFEETVDLPEINDAPVDEILGLDSDASSGFDQFGLVAKKGGVDLLKSGGRSSVEFDLARVKNLIEQHLHAALDSDNQLKSKVYSIVVKFWLDANGFVEKVEVVNTTGDPKLDNNIEYALKNIPPFTSKLLEVPQPVKIRIFTRNFTT